MAKPVSRFPAVRDSDVYALTERGEKELGGAETALSPAEIELLVLTNGQASVAQIRENVRILAADVVVSTYEKLARNGLIGPATFKNTDTLDFGDFLTAGVRAGPSVKALAAAKAEAASGALSLQKDGFYVRIARRAPARPRLAGAEALSVVVVEDEPSLAKFLKQYLAFDGFDVRIAANRSEILAELRRPPLPALVLLDVMLPDADGFDVLLNLRQHPVLKKVPVIMMTAKATRAAVLKGLASGADGYVTKPFEADVLIKAVRSVLGMPDDPGGGRMIRRG